MSIKVSVVVVNYNGLQYLDACLNSILKQDFSDYEVIFVDNASIDGSLEYARRHFPGLVFVANSGNSGYAGGINSGMAVAKGEYVAPINMDTEVTPGWLAAMVDFMDTRPQVGAVCPKVLITDQRNKVNCNGLNIHVSGLGFCRMLHKPDVPESGAHKISGISGCSYLIKKDIFNRMGGAPEYCFMYNDDVVISWLLTMMGYEMYCLPQSVIYHRYRLSMRPEKFFHLEKNRIYLIFSTLKWPTLLLISPILIFVEGMVLVYCFIKGWPYPRSKFGAYLAAFKERKYIGRLRKSYQTLRRVSDFTLLRGLAWNLEWGQLFGIVRFRFRGMRRD
ncbi:MAG: glycosyltransferase family 2 protein [Dehalococcoidia bacterium]